MSLFSKFKAAILKEQEEDVAQTTEYINAYPPKKLAQMGLAVINLNISNMRTGIGGKTILELQLDNAISNGDLSSASMKTGDIVRIDKMTKAKKKDEESKEKDESIEAVVVKVSNLTITVSVDESAGDDKVLNYYNNTNDSTRIWIVKLSNAITYKRMITTMNKVLELKESEKNDIHKLLLGETKYTLSNGNSSIDFFNRGLNRSQKSAIDFAINKSNISIIFGPPGTGKTMTLVELIRQLTTRGEKVLVCGPSNISVDTILERLGEHYKAGELVRIGHPARLLPVNVQHSLEVLSKSYGRDVIKDLENDIQSVLGKIKKCKRYVERKTLYQELKSLKKELVQRERKIVHELLNQAKVVLATLHGAGSYDLKRSGANFDSIIIDEVSQSLEPQCWIPLLHNDKFKRLVIAGDNMQLPPTIMSGTATLLETTLFDRLVNKLEGDKFKKLLNVQYRMNDSIMKFPSMQLYEDKLIGDESVKEIKLTDLPGVSRNDETNVQCVWYDTQGGDFPEQKLESIKGDSKYNEMELQIVRGHVKKLIESGVPPQDIGIIAPYAAQVQLLKKQLGPDSLIEVSTVDGFQGREKEVIILTLVRSNDERDVGFLSEERRLNVAITRPKRQLCVIGDLQLMNDSGHKFLQSWSKYVEDGFEDGKSVRPYEIVYPNIDDYADW
ncbi:Hcs1 protein [Candida orthopsilosis Co 90-125]|uniref:DNA helicase n=1 Tax=Candida orthopsilosis (strain 90-125) TaxID=1136231 RepID=H8WY81_CANO9|nr:Hcs1 protein [Candida orthopsilosis Co 90-125]CCG21196.1 Hcs1 protein [Candida orthopsilosis Co 90-125]